MNLYQISVSDPCIGLALTPILRTSSVEDHRDWSKGSQLGSHEMELP